MKEARHKRISTPSVHLYKIQEQPKLTNSVRNQDSSYLWGGEKINGLGSSVRRGFWNAGKCSNS